MRYGAGMSAEEVAQQIARTDKTLRDGKAVPPEELTINLTTLYRRYGWSRGAAAPLPADAQKKLNLSDRTGDTRWLAHFSRSARQLAVYRSQVGYYWILRYDTMLGEHFLEHAGTAADLEEKYGTGGGG
jgi:hypothetical protein